eukprot:TRINITY_DN14819_c0_g1_i1.p2 TRINITY_DN14819_c0_g1~~TRINITY_DN14819_c0_g1_i1.p2  ORF type:complete len:151 (+),score=18.21 TRINITY_DN14819_c0_g1_i1:231-683(+)
MPCSVRMSSQTHLDTYSRSEPLTLPACAIIVDNPQESFQLAKIRPSSGTRSCCMDAWMTSVLASQCMDACCCYSSCCSGTRSCCMDAWMAEAAGIQTHAWGRAHDKYWTEEWSAGDASSTLCSASCREMQARHGGKIKESIDQDIVNDQI